MPTAAPPARPAAKGVPAPLADGRTALNTEGVRLNLRVHSLWALTVGCAILAGCHGPRTAPAPVAAVPACPAPTLDMRTWTLVSDSAGLTYRLPPTFVERPDARLTYRRWTEGGASSGSVSIGFNHSLEHWITFRRAPSPGMHEMTECIDSIPGREILVQAWRTAGGRFEHGRRSDLYEMLTLVPIEPGLTVWVAGGGADPQFQRILLAISRTVRVPKP